MKKIRALNVTDEGCAFTIRSGYEHHAYLNGMTRGGGFYPASGVIEIYEEEDDTALEENSQKV